MSYRNAGGAGPIGVVWSGGWRPQKASVEAKVGPLSLDEAEHPLKSCLQQQNEDLAHTLMSSTQIRL